MELNNKRLKHDNNNYDSDLRTKTETVEEFAKK
jgi:hypothetical protein